MPPRSASAPIAWPGVAGIVAYGAVLIAAEIVAAAAAPVLAAAIDGTALAALLVHSVLGDERHGRVYAALALVPLLRLSSLALTSSDPVAFLVVSGLPVLLAVTLAAGALDVPGALRLWEIGGRVQWHVAGACVALAVFFAPLLGVAPLSPGASGGEVLVAALVAFLFVGVLEELLFRGVVQGSLDPLLGPLSVPAADVLFTATYLGSGSWSYVLLMAAFGLACGWWVRLSRSVAGVAVGHGLFAVVFLVLWPQL
jgi:membrane protease YdiL (CAAX protease family)